MSHMNKWKALLGATLVVMGMTACANADAEGETERADDTSVIETAAAEETQRETYAPGEDKIIMHVPVSLETEDTSLFVNGVNPWYDRANKTLVFAIDREITYDGELSNDIAATGEGDFMVMKGTLVTDEYPTLCTEGGYRGAAIRLDEEIAPGAYNFNVNFSYFTVSFQITVE